MRSKSEEKLRPFNWAYLHEACHGDTIEQMARTLNQPKHCKLYQWYNYIEDHTIREVSFNKDTFPAMAGVVRKVQEATGATYYAGLWKSHFLDGLLWHFFPLW